MLKYLLCTKEIILGLHVVEVAHDFQQQIRRYVVEDLKMVNSYDTWHGVYVYKE
jgi:hypothetical protein